MNKSLSTEEHEDIVSEKFISAIQASQQEAGSSFDECFFKTNQTYIHPTAVVGKNVQLGTNVKIGPFCVITGSVTIGDNTRIHAHTTVGFPGQVVGLKDSLGTVYIGKDCELREFVTVHASRYPTGQTTIGDRCYLMNFAHVSHDSVLEENVTLINNVCLGGHSHLEKNVIVMAGSATHQFCRIGQFSALAPFSGIRQDLPPFCLFNGQPAHFYGLNTIGLRRAGFLPESINALKHVTKLFYQEKKDIETIIQAAELELVWGNDQAVQTFISYIKNSSRGISRKSVSDNAEQKTEGVSW